MIGWKFSSSPFTSEVKEVREGSLDKSDDDATTPVAFSPFGLELRDPDCYSCSSAVDTPTLDSSGFEAPSSAAGLLAFVGLT
jgi:hypothetical protein